MKCFLSFFFFLLLHKGLFCDQRDKKTTLQFSQTFQYVQQRARLDNTYQKGALVDNSDQILVQDVYFLKVTSFLNYNNFSFFLNQHFFYPNLSFYNQFNETYQSISSLFQHHFETGVFYHLRPFRIGLGYVDHQSNDLLLGEQRWVLNYAKSLKTYSAFQVPIFTLPLHLEGSFNVNPKDLAFREAYFDFSLGFIIYFNYYINMKLGYKGINNVFRATERHTFEFLFSYHLLRYLSFNLGLSKILYSSGESPMDQLVLGFHFYFDIL